MSDIDLYVLHMLYFHPQISIIYQLNFYPKSLHFSYSYPLIYIDPLFPIARHANNTKLHNKPLANIHPPITNSPPPYAILSYKLSPDVHSFPSWRIRLYKPSTNKRPDLRRGASIPVNLPLARRCP